VPAELAWRHEVMDRFGLWARLWEVPLESFPVAFDAIGNEFAV
jgi:hypothetical protein